MGLVAARHAAQTSAEAGLIASRRRRPAVVQVARRWRRASFADLAEKVFAIGESRIKLRFQLLYLTPQIIDVVARST